MFTQFNSFGDSVTLFWDGDPVSLKCIYTYLNTLWNLKTNLRSLPTHTYLLVNQIWTVTQMIAIIRSSKSKISIIKTRKRKLFYCSLQGRIYLAFSLRLICNANNDVICIYKDTFTSCFNTFLTNNAWLSVYKTQACSSYKVEINCSGHARCKQGLINANLWLEEKKWK